MKKQLVVEFRRMLKAPTFYIAVLLGLFIAISHVIQITLPLANANETAFYTELDIIPHSVFTCMMDMGRGSFSWQPSLLINIAPILAALPFGVSFYCDKRTGYIKNCMVRESKGAYLWAKYIITFISGGFVLALPVFVNFIGNCMLVPLIKPMRGTHLFAYVPSYIENIYYDMPVLYILLICILYFMIGGLLATMCLGAAYLVDIIFLVQLFPVIFVYLYNVCANTFSFLELKLFYAYLSIEIPQYIEIMDFVKIFVLMGVFSIIYFYNGYREETL